MGDDYSNHQIFVGEAEPQEFRCRFVEHLNAALISQGYVAVQNPEIASRAFAIGKTERWICLYDSAGSGDITDSGHFKPLSLQLSRFAPVVDIHMSDSCAVHFHLYENGDETDRFGNIKGVVGQWQSEEERLSFRGRTDLWRRFLLDTNDERTLRATWDNDYATTILARTAQLVGWNETYCDANLTIDYEGVPVFYREHFRRESTITHGQFLQDFPPLDFFEELYFSNQ